MTAQHGPIDPVSILNWKDTDIETAIRLPVDWAALQEYALQLRRSLWQGSDTPPFSTCVLLPQYNFGGLHIVRIIEYDDGERWVARIQLHGGTYQASQRLVHEVHTLSCVRERTRIPVPRIFGFESTTSNRVGVPFFLMKFIPGNTAMDAFGGHDVHRGEIPAQYKRVFMQQVARMQAEMASVRFPKIGRVIRQEDGTYTVGPFPDLGGPFSTAAEYLRAWAQHAKFPRTEAQLQYRVPKGLQEEISSSIRDFPSRLEGIAGRISLHSGPFPLYHTDFLHSNIIIDPNCKVLAIIDWENASTVPWEVVEFPLFLSTTPPPMDAPWNYDDKGVPTDSSMRQRWAEKDEYVGFVRKPKQRRGWTGTCRRR